MSGTSSCDRSRSSTPKQATSGKPAGGGYVGSRATGVLDQIIPGFLSVVQITDDIHEMFVFTSLFEQQPTFPSKAHLALLEHALFDGTS